MGQINVHSIVARINGYVTLCSALGVLMCHEDVHVTTYSFVIIMGQVHVHSIGSWY